MWRTTDGQSFVPPPVPAATAAPTPEQLEDQETMRLYKAAISGMVHVQQMQLDRALRVVDRDMLDQLRYFHRMLDDWIEELDRELALSG